VRARCAVAATVMLRAGARSVSASRIGIPRHDVGLSRRTGVRHAGTGSTCPSSRPCIISTVHHLDRAHVHHLDRASSRPCTCASSRPCIISTVHHLDRAHLCLSVSLSLCLSVPRSLRRLLLSSRPHARMRNLCACAGQCAQAGPRSRAPRSPLPPRIPTVGGESSLADVLEHAEDARVLRLVLQHVI